MKFIFLLVTFNLCALDVLVTLPPLAFFVERVGGDLVTVQSLMPPGASPHTYEPTPQEMRQAVASEMWFQIGEPVEKRVEPALRGVQLIDLAQGINLLKGCPHCGADLHFWLSPKEAEIFSRTIAKALISAMPEKQVQIEGQLERLLEELRALNHELEAKLKPCKGEAVVVSHPSFAYFCRDYGFTELAIEVEGKEPSPRQLNQLLQEARGKAHVVIVQPQFNPKAAERVAKELGLPTCTVNPLSPEPLETMRRLAECICPLS